MLSPDQLRQIQIIACIGLGAWLVSKGVVPAWTVPHSDFSNYYASARLVTEGASLDSLYDNEWFHEQMGKLGISTPGKFAPFPPLTSWIMVPLTWLPPLQAQRLFMVFNLVFVLVCAWYWKKVTGWKALPSILIVLAAGSSLSNNIAFGQLYLITTALMLLSVDLINQRRSWLAGVIIGIITAIKYFPVVIIVGLVALMVTDWMKSKAYITTVFSFALTMSILIAVQFAFFGTHLMIEYFTQAFVPHLASDLKGQGMYSMLFQSWDSLARNLFVYDVIENPNPWIDWQAGKTVLKVLAAAIVGATCSVVMFVNRRSAYRNEIFIAVPALAMLVILPASATYHFIMLLLPMAMMMRVRKAWVIIVLFVAIGFIPYGWFFAIAESFGLVFGYPRLWLVTILFAAASLSLVRKPSMATAP